MEGVKPMLALVLVLQVISTVFSGLNLLQKKMPLAPVTQTQEDIKVSPYNAPLSQQGDGNVKKGEDKLVAKGQTPVLSGTTDELQLGETAPMFRMQDMSGEWMSLAQFKNKKNVVLVAWLQSCPHCLEFLPKLNDFAKKVKGNKKIQIITVTRAASFDEEGKLRSILKTGGYNFTVLLSKANSFGQDYKLHGVPTVWIIDTNLKVRAIFRGSELEGDDLKSLLLKPLGM